MGGTRNKIQNVLEGEHAAKIEDEKRSRARLHGARPKDDAHNGIHTVSDVAFGFGRIEVRYRRRRRKGGKENGSPLIFFFFFIFFLFLLLFLLFLFHFSSSSSSLFSLSPSQALPNFSNEHRSTHDAVALLKRLSTGKDLCMLIFFSFLRYQCPFIAFIAHVCVFIYNLDRAILSIMKKYGWYVHMLKEFPPSMETGIVGVTGSCLLGFNENKGEVIGLRLRTGDTLYIEFGRGRERERQRERETEKHIDRILSRPLCAADSVSPGVPPGSSRDYTDSCVPHPPQPAAAERASEASKNSNARQTYIIQIIYTQTDRHNHMRTYAYD